jgi:hypothetical protein
VRACVRILGGLSSSFNRHFAVCLRPGCVAVLWSSCCDAAPDLLGLCEPLPNVDAVTGALFDWIGGAIQYMAMAGARTRVRVGGGGGGL